MVSSSTFQVPYAWVNEPLHRWRIEQLPQEMRAALRQAADQPHPTNVRALVEATSCYLGNGHTIRWSPSPESPIIGLLDITPHRAATHWLPRLAFDLAHDAVNPTDVTVIAELQPMPGWNVVYESLGEYTPANWVAGQRARITLTWRDLVAPHLSETTRHELCHRRYDTRYLAEKKFAAGELSPAALAQIPAAPMRMHCAVERAWRETSVDGGSVAREFTFALDEVDAWRESSQAFLELLQNGLPTEVAQHVREQLRLKIAGATRFAGCAQSLLSSAQEILECSTDDGAALTSNELVLRTVDANGLRSDPFDMCTTARNGDVQWYGAQLSARQLINGNTRTPLQQLRYEWETMLQWLTAQQSDLRELETLSSTV